MKKNILLIILLLLVASTLGCATLPMFRDRQSVAENIARQAGLSKEYLNAGDFTLLSYQRFNQRADSLRIYIEGDGRAWENKNKLSRDPTPSNPVALRLAAADQADNLAYIARPGQYPELGSPECEWKYWSTFRFASEVVEAFNLVIDGLKEKSGAKHVELVGYSGGGAIAVLVAARRSDVIGLRTVAGNLNPKAFCVYHRVSQLDGSLDPLEVAQKIAHIPQRHFVGSKDKITPLILAESFVEAEGDKDYARITVVDGATHNQGWEKRWDELLLIQLK